MFVFTFEHVADRDLAFSRRPWTIRGAHLILKIWNQNLSYSEVDFPDLHSGYRSMDFLRLGLIKRILN